MFVTTVVQFELYYPFSGAVGCIEYECNILVYLKVAGITALMPAEVHLLKADGPMSGC